MNNQTDNKINLPGPEKDSNTSIEEALAQRRSIREYQDQALSLQEVSQLLWACQGITSEWGGRTAPSAGATYPLELYLVAGKVEGLPEGVYHYLPEEHSLEKLKGRDVRQELAAAALGQAWVQLAPINIVMTGVYERTTGRYGERGVRYVHMEAGHAAQNIYLEAVRLDLGTVVVGAFDDNKVSQIIGLESGEHPLYIIPAGKKK